MRKYVFILLPAAITFSCGGNKTEEPVKNNTPWIGQWQMVGYDNVSVADSSTVIFMNLNEDNTIVYLTKTREGETLIADTGNYKINDQHSVLSVYESQRLVIEYFIRKLDDDSLIFQSDTFSIKWKRID